MIDPRIVMLLQLVGRWYTKASEFNLAVMLILYIVGCVVVGHPLSIHEFERFVHHTFNSERQITPLRAIGKESQFVKVTPQLIRKYFGDDAKIERRFFGGYRVTTWTGGDIDIDGDGETRIHAGGDDVYEAMMLMLSHKGNSVTVWGGSEHITAVMSHGIANDIVVIPEVRQGGGCLRLFVVILVFFITLGVLGPRFPHGRAEWIVIFIAFALSRWVWVSMKRAQKRAERRAGQVYRYQFARVLGGPRDASRRDAERKGWL